MSNIAKTRGHGVQRGHHHTAVHLAGTSEIAYARLCQPGPLWPAAALRFKREWQDWRICHDCQELADRQSQAVDAALAGVM